jgi:putative two-component system response regulator
VRAYKKAFTSEEANKIIEEGAGKHFDPVLIDVFRKVAGEFAKAARKINSEQ